ncbi:peptide deformylase [Candidatus Gracilibacteria bacterium 28_42_T64]|nr:peptide deformylase [Candidatus Gracilibacteria bacterium 28_42_T64]
MLHIETGTNNQVLRKVSDQVKQSEIKKIEKLGNQMIKYVKNPDNNGVGLAAPQVGVNKRLIVVSLLKDRDDEDFKTIMMINPEILTHSDNMDKEEEGCLSIPGMKGNVERYHTIKLKYLDGKGKDRVLLLEGVSSRIVQHEIDHINGVLFVDKLV